MVFRSYVVGLTGGIGSGKSTVANLFSAHGVTVIDTDAIAHELTAPHGAAIAAIRDAFGDKALDGDRALDRAAMRQRVFFDPGERRKLEEILHPMIRGVVEVALARGPNLPMPYMMLVVPLMFESMGFRAIVDRTLAVDCPEYLQLARVKNRSGMEFETVARIMATQVSRALRLQIADDVIFNAADVSALHGQVAALHQRYLALAGSVS